MTTGTGNQFEVDLDRTRTNRILLQRNPNLLFWYHQLYRRMFIDVPDIASKRILEIGSGTSPLKTLLPNVLASDVLPLEHLDLVFDCHQIRNFRGIPDNSMDIITMTNVLHHLRDPIGFLQGASHKLAPGGGVYLVEPFFSLVSHPIYRFLHHELVEFNIERPVLDDIEGPLATANQAIPYLIFFRRKTWYRELADSYALEKTRIDYFSSLSYMATGGISRRIPLPHWLYRAWFALDQLLAARFPRIFAAFFIVKLRSAR